MNTFLLYFVTGLVTGAVYGLAATGLVLTYKTTGIFNFAYGSIAAMGVFVFYWLNVQEKLPWGLAAAIVVLVVAPVEGLLLELLGRILENQGNRGQGGGNHWPPSDRLGCGSTVVRRPVRSDGPAVPSRCEVLARWSQRDLGPGDRLRRGGRGSNGLVYLLPDLPAGHGDAGHCRCSGAGGPQR